MPIKTVKNGAEWTLRGGYESIPDRLYPDDFRSGIDGENYTFVEENRVRSVISMPVTDINENGIYIQ